MNTKNETEELKISACGTNAPRESLDTFTALERVSDALWDVYMAADEVPK